jgi:hypothetical protein
MNANQRPFGVSSSGISARQGREEAHDYVAVVVALNPSWRIIRANRAPPQWIIQRRSGQREGLPIWRGESFHQDRESLIRRAGELASIITAPALIAMHELPVHIRDERP